MKRKEQGFWLIATACIFAALAVWFGYKTCGILRDYQQGEEDLDLVHAVMDELMEANSAQAVTLEPKNGGDSGGGLSGNESQAAWMRQEALKELKKINEDLTGWVKIDGTAVDYPVMHTPENPEFYLTHGFDKGTSAYGMIFMDGECSPDIECMNYILYGHHMKNGAMFGELKNYSSREYLEEHPVIKFDTLNEHGCYEVAAAFKLPTAQIDAEFCGWLAAVTEEDYEKLIRYAGDHGFYDTGITPEWPEKLLTLVTCEYTEKNGRFFVIARRIENSLQMR